MTIKPCHRRITASQSSAASTASDNTPALGNRPHFRMSTLAWHVAIGMGSFIIPFTGNAQIIADGNAPKAHQPQILLTTGNIPQVDIQTPSAAGVSLNEYRQFDVATEGAILNNARKAAPTHIGGMTSANPNLLKGEAAVIINQINSSNPSHLHGQLEVAGKRADVIMANPAGISVNGGSIINAGKAILTTGTPKIDQNGFQGVDVERGKISIGEQGLSVANSDYAAIIAREAAINGPIQTGDKALDVLVGSQSVSADGTVQATKSSDRSVTRGLDTGKLGGMYAGSIRLISTEKGLGVHHRGTVRSEQLSITIPGTLRNEGEITSSQINIRSSRLENSGTLHHNSNGMLNIDATSITNAKDGVIKKKKTQQNNQNPTTDTAPAEPVNHLGHITVSETLINTGDITSQGFVNLNTANLENHGLLHAQKLNLQGGIFDNQRGAIAIEEASIHAHRMNNRGGNLQLGTARPISVTESLDNTSGAISSPGNLSLRARQINNIRNGTISSDAALRLVAKEDIINGGTLSGQILHLEAEALSNYAEGKILQNGPYTLNIDTADYDTANNPFSTIVRKQPSGTPVSGSPSSSASDREGKLKVHSHFDNRGFFEINGPTSVTASRSFTNHKDIELAGLSLHNGAALNNSGGTIRAPKILLSTSHIDNAGGQLKTNTLSLQSKSLDNRGGHIDIATDGHITISEEWQNQDGKTSSNNPLRINTRNTYNDRGEIQSASSINIANSGLWDNGTGQLLAQKNLAIAGGSLKNSGKLQAGEHLAYTNMQRLEQDGKLFANTGNIAGNTFSNSGETAFLEQANIQTANTDNRGKITSSSDINVKSDTLANSGLMHARQTLDLQTDNLQNSGNISSDDLGISAENELNNQQGTLAGKRRINLTAAHVQNRSGKIGSEAEVSLAARQLDNQHGQIASKNKLFLHIDERIDNQRGELAASDAWSLTTQHLHNQSGHVFAGKSLDIRTQTLDNSGGIINADVHTLSSGKIVNAGGKLLAQQSLSVQSDGSRLDNRDGLLASRGNLNVSGHTEIDSRSGGRVSGENVRLNVNQITGGTFHSNNDLSLSARRFDDVDHVSAGGDLDINSQEHYHASVPHYSLGETTIHSKEGLTIDRSGRLVAEGNLSLYADNLINEGVISSAGRTRLYIDNHTENRNGGAIFGRHVAIGTQNLLNTKTKGDTAGAIAATERLDIGAKNIQNDNNAGLYSFGSLHVGGDLDRKHAAEGHAETLTNDNGGVIQANTLLSLAINQIDNLDSTHRIEEVIKERTGKDFYTNFYTQDWIPGSQQSAGEFFNGYKYAYEEQKIETQSIPGNPGKILSGGHIAFDGGSVRNHGYIAAASVGGTANVDNDQRPGKRIIRASGGTVHEKDRDDRWKRAGSYTPPDIENPITFEIGKVEDKPHTIGTPVSLPGGNRDRIITVIDADGKTVQWQTTEDDYLPELPKNSLFTLNIANVDLQPGASHGEQPSAQLGLITLNPELAKIPGIPQELSSGFTFVLPPLPGAESEAPRVDHSQLVGDAYYLRELVTQEVLRRTGHRYLQGHSNDSEQFRHLFAKGQQFRDKYQIAPGVSLTPEQMSKLSDDMVLMVNKTITLPDGRQVVRQVPQLYTKVRPKDIANRPVISGDHVDLRGNTLANRAAISGRSTLNLRYDHIHQQGILASNRGKVHANDTFRGHGGEIRTDGSFSVTTKRLFDSGTIALINDDATPKVEFTFEEAVAGAVRSVNSVESLGYNSNEMGLIINRAISTYQIKVQEGKSHEEAYAAAVDTKTPGLTFSQTKEKLYDSLSSAAKKSFNFSLNVAKTSADIILLDDLRSIINPQSPTDFIISAVSTIPVGKPLKILKIGNKADKANDIRKAVENSQKARQSSNFSTHIGKERAIQENIQKRIDNPDLGIEELMKNSARRKDTMGRTIQFDRFEKGYNQANIDFDFLKPNNIRAFEKNGITGRLGTLSDGRNVNVRNRSSKEGPPTVEIQNKNNSFKFRY